MAKDSRSIPLAVSLSNGDTSLDELGTNGVALEPVFLTTVNSVTWTTICLVQMILLGSI